MLPLTAETSPLFRGIEARSHAPVRAVSAERRTMRSSGPGWQICTKPKVEPLRSTRLDVTPHAAEPMPSDYLLILKFTLLLSTPVGVVTKTGPVVVPAGTTAVM